MNSREYEKNVLITESNDFDAIKSRIDEPTIRLLHAVMGLSSELAEIQCALDSTSLEGVIDYVNLREEAGDLSWYAAIAIHVLGFDPEEIWPFADDAENTLFSSVESIKNMQESMVTEVGLLQDILKRTLFYGKPFETDTVKDALIGLCSAISSLSFACGANGAQVKTTNIAKLRSRYGDKFTEVAALHRDLKTERSILEQ